MQWFKTLPLFLDFDTVRCIHACWDQDAIDRLKTYLNPDYTLKEEYWLDVFNPEHELYTLCETLLKGPEIALPDGYFFNDKNGVQRHHLRMAWWKSDAATYRDIGLVQPKEQERIPNLPIPSQQQAKAMDVPVVVGHYTLISPPDSLPKPSSSKVVCVDYNAASQKGKLVGYWMELDANDEDEFPRVTERQFCYPDAPTIESYIDDGVYELLKAFVNSLPDVKHPDPQQEDAFCLHLSEVLFNDWDPIGVAGDEDLRDEYYSYEPDVIKLAKTGKVEALSAYLFLTHTVIIGMSENADTRLKCQRIGHELIQYWCTLNEVTV